MALATLVSRVLGLVREAVFAALFATTWLADAFVFAFRIPNLLRDFFAEGALSSAFVPTFTEVERRDGPARAILLARRALGTLFVVTMAIATLGILFAPAIVSWVAVDAPSDLMPTIVRLVRILFPFLALVALAAVAMGVLNARGRYFIPALAPAFFNVAAVVGGGVLLLVGGTPGSQLDAWAAFVLVGGALQFLVQVPALRQIGWRGGPLLDLRFRDPGLRQVAARMGPIVLSTAATNIMLVVATALASREQGWASSLSYAFRLVHLPIGLIGVALGTVVLSAGARRRAAADEAGLEDLGRRALRLNALLALPAAVGLFVLAEPIVRLIYERGSFAASSTREVAQVLAGYALGTVGYAGVKAAAPLFLARGDTRTPMLCSLLGIGVNLVVSLALIDAYGHVALAGAVALGATVNFIALRFVAWRRHGKRSFPGAAFHVRVLAANVGLAFVAYALSRTLLAPTTPGSTLYVLPAAIALACFYGLLLRLLGVPETVGLRAFLGRKRA